LTETAIVANLEVSAQVLREVSKMGIQISVDDFGTGYSSLSYLQSFPIDSLKIDQSFVRNLTTDSGNADGSLAGAIVALGHSLGLKVVAEGVENEEQLEFLKENGCDSIQGYLFCVPGPVDEISKYLNPAPVQEHDEEADLPEEDTPDESPEAALVESVEDVVEDVEDPDESEEVDADESPEDVEEAEESAEVVQEETLEADAVESPEDAEEPDESAEVVQEESPEDVEETEESAESGEAESEESTEEAQEESVKASTDS